MRVLQINTTCGSGSTGKIAVAISEMLDAIDSPNQIICVKCNDVNCNHIVYDNKIYYKLQALKSRVFGNYGFNTRLYTRRIIKNIEEFAPDIVQLHNIHGHNINIEILFNYLRKKGLKVVWTFHDCWAFTGYCTHYDMIGCEKWKIQCENCIKRPEYSWFFDKSRRLFNKKKTLLSNIDLTIVTPSDWMARQVKLSFLKDRSVFVINNGIDLNIFKPGIPITNNVFDEKKILILAVSFVWDNKKGLDVLTRLSHELTSAFQLIVVGVNNELKKEFSDSTICINKTENQTELASLYGVADLFVNPTREDTFPTVNIEAIACGTPVLTFDTGGSKEILDDKTGFYVNKNDYESFKRIVLSINKKSQETVKNCRMRSEQYVASDKYIQYVELYRRLYTQE